MAKNRVDLTTLYKTNEPCGSKTNNESNKNFGSFLQSMEDRLEAEMKVSGNVCFRKVGHLNTNCNDLNCCRILKSRKLPSMKT